MRPSTKWQVWIVFMCLVAVGCTGVIGNEDGIGLRPTTGQGGAGGSIGVPTGGNGSDPGGAGSPGSGSGGSIVGTGSGSSAYCDLQQMLRTRCDGCHSNPPVSGAPMPLITYADLLAPARSNPARMVADVALERMQDPVRPMPPAPAPHATAAEVSILANWISAGSPVVCTSSPPATGTGTSGAGGAGPGVDAGGPIGTGGSSGAITGDAGTTSTALCALQQTLRTRCVSCHSNPPVNGAPMPLITYADLIAPARSNPARRVADVALTRMQDPVSPMPPAPAPRATAAEIGTLSNWIAAGSPAVCVPGTGGTDAGVVTGNPPPPPPPPPVVCTSGQRWTGGNTGSPLMHPGVGCLSCHSGGGGGGEEGEGAPLWTIAGTVYPTVREPNDCNGVNGTAAGVQVIVTDAAGRVLTLPVNTSGNFYTNAAVTFPFHARVVRGGVVRMMMAAQSNGNCNGCHTQDGANGAPGRIVVP